jgi:hypothetical protein
MSDERNGARVFVLCLEERQSFYKPFCEKWGDRVRFVDNIDDLFMEASDIPPQGVLVDIMTSVRIGAAVMNPLLNLEMAWPVARCRTAPDGNVSVICSEPRHNEPLSTALDGMLSDDSTWRHPRYKRRFIRVNVECRVRIHCDGEADWRVGNALNVSMAGAFVFMQSPPPGKVQIELEFRDIVPSPTSHRAVTVWSRSWEASPALPGLAIQFDPAVISDELRQKIRQLARPSNWR